MCGKRLWIIASAAALVLGALAYGCTGGGSCADLETCPVVDASAGDAAVADGMADGGAEAADAASDEAASTEDVFVCDPTKDPQDQPCVLDDAYGVFVASPAGVDGGVEAGGAGAVLVSGDGSMARPYATIGQALANRGTKTRIYVCNGLYGEQVNVTAAVSIYGGLSCSAGAMGRVWTYVGGSAQVNSPSSTYALSLGAVVFGGVDGGTDAGEGGIALEGTVTIEDMSFTSPSATAAGGSSIAAFVASSSVNLVRVTLSAGRGADGAGGAAGMASPNFMGSAPDGGAQVYSANDAGPGFVTVSGGQGGTNGCLPYGSSTGGDGGLGCTSLGTPGTASPPAPASVGRDGLPRGAALPDGGTVADNDPGGDGVAGDGGVPAPAQVYGTLSLSGWLPSPGGDGLPGNPGQGGAGATDPLFGACSAPTPTVGGGGGGAGGCGGAGGKGGRGGGASIALASLASSVVLTECTLMTAAGGTGGAGGAGQDGQAGGAGGNTPPPSGTAAAASGAAGGNGAGGSGGAGGTGGVSVGVLHAGSMIMSDVATNQNVTLGPPGAGGAAGAAGRHPTGGLLTTGMDGNPGAPGSAGTSAAFLKLM